MMALYMIPPVSGFITQHFGEVNDAGWSHRGIDYSATIGTPVKAAASGRVINHTPGDGWGDGSFGICTVIDHPGTPYYSLVAHLSRHEWPDNAIVVQGEVVGLSGNTGKSTGPHVHFQVNDEPGFTTDLRHVFDPNQFFISPPIITVPTAPVKEDDTMDKQRLALMRLAAGPYEAMNAAYNALEAAQLVLPDDDADNLNAAEMRRWRIMEVAAGNDYQAAYNIVNR